MTEDKLASCLNSFQSMIYSLVMKYTGAMTDAILVAGR